MVVLNLGYTAPINRPNQHPILTLSQVWTGLQHKVRRAEKFVPLITACEVLTEATPPDHESGAARVITRRVTFRPDAAAPGGNPTVTEVCHLYPPCRVVFEQEDGSTIGNYVTQGPSGEAEDLFMTYVFEWNVPGVGEGSEEARALEEKYRKMAKMAVESSIETIRKIALGEVTLD